MPSNRRVSSVGGSSSPGLRVRSDGSPAFVAWADSETAATDTDGYLGIFDGTDANFEANGLIMPTAGHGYLNLVHVGDGTVSTPPTVLVLGRILPTVGDLGSLSHARTAFASLFRNKGPVVPLRELGADVGTETFALSATAGQSTDYHVSDVSRVYVAGASEVAVLVTSAASVSSEGCIVGWFSS